MRLRILSIAILSVAAGSTLVAAPQDAPKPGIETQLRRAYPLARVGVNGVVAQPGTILVVQMDNIKSNPADRQVYWPNTFKRGSRVKQSLLGEVSFVSMKDVARLLGVGEKAYLTKLEIKATEVVLGIQSCGTCNAAGMDQDNPPYRAAIAFQFGKGYLASSEFQDIQDAIAQVFTVDKSAPSAPAPTTAAPMTQPAAAPPVQQQAAPVVPAVPEPQVAQSEPATVALGQSKDQVLATLGQPMRVAKGAGNKELLFYKDMKVTLVDGKVSDIQ
jgi:hypothetical protein